MSDTITSGATLLDLLVIWGGPLLVLLVLWFFLRRQGRVVDLQTQIALAEQKRHNEALEKILGSHEALQKIFASHEVRLQKIEDDKRGQNSN